MVLLIAAALLWLGLHVGVSGTPLRGVVVRAIGEKPFASVFSLLAAVFLVLLILAYRWADTVPLWFAPPWLVAVIDAVMLIALFFFVAAFIRPRGAGEGPRGIARVTRHPLMTAFGLWSTAHLVANGDTASLVFFGTFLLTVLLGVPAQDAKLGRRDPVKAAAQFPTTSQLPFAAILAGRNRLVVREIGWLPPLLGLVLWVALLHLHPLVIGVPATPVW
jgi:uncharacterized membrane protein